MLWSISASVMHVGGWKGCSPKVLFPSTPYRNRLLRDPFCKPSVHSSVHSSHLTEESNEAMKIQASSPRSPDGTSSSGPSFHHSSPPPESPALSDPDDEQRGVPRGVNGMHGSPAQGASANVQDPPAEGSPGTFRIGALLEGSLLLLV